MDNGISLTWIFVILLIALVVFILTIVFSVQDAEKSVEKLRHDLELKLESLIKFS